MNPLEKAFLEDRDLPPPDSDDDFDVEEDCCKFLKDLLNGKKPKNGTVAKLAHLLGVSQAELFKLRDGYLEGKSTNVESSSAS